MNKSIHDIWKSFQAGNSEAFAYIYNLHLDSLFRYGTKLCDDDDLVKDAIQEVYLDLYLKKEKNNSNPQHLKFYLLLSLKHNLVKKLQKRRRMVNDDSDGELSFEPEYSIEHDIIEEEQNRELSEKLTKVIQQLPARQKEALYLRFNESMEYEDISRMLNISVESARKQVYRALKTVREMMEKETLYLFFLW